MSFFVGKATAPIAQYSGYRSYQVPFIARNNLAAVAQQYGFVAQNIAGAIVYVHPTDQSWLAHNPQTGRIERGAGNVIFQGVPGRQAAPAQPAPQPAYQPAAQPNRNGLPSMQWSYYQQFQIGQLPQLSYQTAPGVLQGRGFTQSQPGYWTHGDGTWVRINGTSLTLGFKQWHLGQLPYNNRIPQP